MFILRCESLTRTYVSGGREITVLRDITFDLEPGGFLAVTGPSGSGKSTLLGLLAGLDRPTRGRVVLDGRDLAALTEDERARVRAEAVGFVFQSFHLIPTLTARENVQVPLELRGEDGAGPRGRAARPGRPRRPRATTTPPSSRGASSSGWRWRAPSSTGRRSSSPTSPPATSTPRTAQNVVALLGELNREVGTTLVLVTHELDLAARARRDDPPARRALVEDTAGAARREPPPLRPHPRLAGVPRPPAPALLLIVLAVAIGVAALVAINSFTDNLRDSVRPGGPGAPRGRPRALDGRALLARRAEALLDEVRRATSPPAGAWRGSSSFGAMALVPGGATTRLVQVRAVDPGYPFYGAIETAPAGEWTRLAETGGAWSTSRCSSRSGRSVGDEIALGEARFVVAGDRDSTCRATSACAAPSARGSSSPARGSAETGLLTRGSRARYEAYLRLPPGTDAQGIADRFRPRLSAERLSIRTVSEDQRRLSDDALAVRATSSASSPWWPSSSAASAWRAPSTSSSSAAWRRWPSCAAWARAGGTVLAAYLVQAVALGLIGSLAGAALGAGVQVVLPRLLKDLLPVDVSWSLSWPASWAASASGCGWRSSSRSCPCWPSAASPRSPSCGATSRRTGRAATRPARRRRWPSPASLVALAVIQAGRLVASASASPPAIGVALVALWLAALLLVRGLRRFFPRRLPYLYRQGLANLYRPANQTLTVVLSLGFGAFLLSTLFLVQHNLLRDLRVDRGADRPNVVFFDVQPDQRDDVEARVSAAGPARRRRSSPIVPMRIQSLKGRPAARAARDRGRRAAGRSAGRSAASTAAATATRRRRPSGWSRARGGGPASGRAGRDGEPVPIALEAGLARELRGGRSATRSSGTSRASRCARRVAALREVDWARFEPNFFVVFPEGPLDAAAAELRAAHAGGGPRRRAPGSSARSWRRTRTSRPSTSPRCSTPSRASSTGWSSPSASWPSSAWPPARVVLAGAVASSRYQRVREGALLRTLGARRGQLLRILLAEYAVLGALAAGTAILLSTLAGWALVRFVFGGTLRPARAVAARPPPLGPRPHRAGGPLRQHRGVAPPAARGAARGVSSRGP